MYFEFFKPFGNPLEMLVAHAVIRSLTRGTRSERSPLGPCHCVNTTESMNPSLGGVAHRSPWFWVPAAARDVWSVAARNAGGRAGPRRVRRLLGWLASSPEGDLEGGKVFGGSAHERRRFRVGSMGEGVGPGRP